MQSSKISTIRGTTMKIVQLLTDKLLNGCRNYHLLQRKPPAFDLWQLFWNSLTTAQNFPCCTNVKLIHVFFGFCFSKIPFLFFAQQGIIFSIKIDLDDEHPFRQKPSRWFWKKFKPVFRKVKQRTIWMPMKTFLILRKWLSYHTILEPHRVCFFLEYLPNPSWTSQSVFLSQVSS